VTITSTCVGTSRLALRRLSALALAVLVALIITACGGGSSSVPISYRSFIEQVQAGNVRSISAAGRAIAGTFKHPVTYPPTAHAKTARFSVEIPTYAPVAPLVRLLRRERVRVSGLRRSD
jgi:hypothetical protein